jgi:hypothetical protein
MIGSMLGRWLDARHLYLLHRISGASIGDTLTATAFMRGVHEKTGRRFIVVSKYPEIFTANPLVERNIGFGQLGPLSKPLAKAVLRHARHRAIGEHGYRPPAHFTEEDIARDHRRPISEAQFCAEALEQEWGVKLDWSRLVPELYFGEEELAALAARFKLPPKYGVIRPVGNLSYTPNREWGFERFQEVVRRTPWITWVQPGPPSEPRLEGAIDLCGKSSIRELFFIIRGARGVLSVEGLPNHVAAAFRVPSFVVFSGFNRIELSRYAVTVPIVRDPQVECAPCWKLTPCPEPGKPCTNDITVDQVVQALEQHWPK